MWKILFTSFLLLSLTDGTMFAQNFSGIYGVEIDGETITLELTQDAKGNVTGTMRVEGISYTVKGRIQNDRINGSMDAFEETLQFSAQINDNTLVLTRSDPEEVPDPHVETSEKLVFRRLKSQASAGEPESSASGEVKSQNTSGKNKVVINDITLSAEQIAELEQTYGTKPLPGTYWYDSRSGLYGVVGFPSYGFMLTGHDFGKLDKNASNGDTGVFVNGRELPQAEWAVWSQLLGYIIPPGRYWLDENGNAGYEGNPIPTENLYLAAQRNAYGGSGGGGDNFWSSRFGAGNYDPGNQRGYVSVPGYGPVGYGF